MRLLVKSILVRQGKDEVRRGSLQSHRLAGGSQELQLAISLLPRFHSALRQWLSYLQWFGSERLTFSLDK
jgi:hypothetical protein